VCRLSMTTGTLDVALSRQNAVLLATEKMGRTGLEPVTLGLKVPCSTS
jgi:hypothetical protein